MKSDHPLPLPRDELVAIRDGNRRNADIRKLLIEIRRQHDVILQVARFVKTIDQSWNEEVGSSLTAIFVLKNLLREEVGRFSGDLRQDV